jgi:DNA-binding beta-propeller fold protein YncE
MSSTPELRTAGAGATPTARFAGRQSLGEILGASPLSRRPGAGKLPPMVTQAKAALVGVLLVAGLCTASACAASVWWISAPAAAAVGQPRQTRLPLGALTQLSGWGGCTVDRSTPQRGCAPARALRGPGPFVGSHAIAVSPDGRNLYVASSDSNAVAVFERNPRTGTLSQAAGAAGCIAAAGADGCARAVGLDGPNSVAISPDGRNVYATSLDSDSITVFRRDATTGALSQPAGAAGCIAGVASRGCANGRALHGPAAVAVSPDGTSVYVASFTGNAIAVFARNPSNGALTQLSGSAGCIAQVPGAGCATGIALTAPEGVVVSADGENVYVASAGSGAVDVMARNPSTGALTQAADGSGCIAAAIGGCGLGRQLGGADAVAIGPDDQDVYVTAALSNSVATFTRTAGSGELTQPSGADGCAIYLLAVACSLGRTLIDPEGLAVSPDGANVYAASFASGAIDSFDRDEQTGALMQIAGEAGCVASRPTVNCARGRGLLGASSLALSPGGKYLYAAAFASNAVAVFKRQTKG